MKTLDPYDITSGLKKRKNPIFTHVLLCISLIFLLFGLPTYTLIPFILVLCTELYLLKMDIKVHKSSKAMKYSILCLPVIKKDCNVSYEDTYEAYYLYFSETASCKVSHSEYLAASINDLYYVIYIDGRPVLCYSTQQYELDDTLRTLLK